MRYRLSTVDKNTKKPGFYWRCYTSIDDALWIPSQLRLTRDKVKELSTGNANEYVFAAFNNLLVVILDETHPLFNLNIFHLEDWEKQDFPISEYTLSIIENGVRQLILNVVEDLLKK